MFCLEAELLFFFNFFARYCCNVEHGLKGSRGMGIHCFPYWNSIERKDGWICSSVAPSQSSSRSRKSCLLCLRDIVAHCYPWGGKGHAVGLQKLIFVHPTRALFPISLKREVAHRLLFLKPFKTRAWPNRITEALLILMSQIVQMGS